MTKQHVERHQATFASRAQAESENHEHHVTIGQVSVRIQRQGNKAVVTITELGSNGAYDRHVASVEVLAWRKQ